MTNLSCTYHRHPGLAHVSLVRSLSADFTIRNCRKQSSTLQVSCCYRHHRHALPALDLDGQNVIIVGLGASGRSAALLALERGATVLALDQNTTKQPLEVDPRFAAHAATRRLRTELGPHRADALHDADTLVLSPGVPLTQPAVEAALECGVPAVSELGFAFAALPVALPLAAVTGTNGKSTVTTFSAQLLRACGLTTWAGGNLGTPLSELALACRHGAHFDAAVVEVSSYQLQLPGSFQPNVGVVLNVTPDHLERHLSMLHYAAAKCNCFAHMTPDDLAIIQEDDEVIAQLLADCGGHPERAWLGRLPGCTLQGSQAHLQLPGWDDALELDLSGLTVPGRHNLMNAATAALLAVALPVGVTRERLQAALPALQPPPHRMQVLGQLDGITWIDDSKATNLEAAIAGISGLEGPAVVLLGGQAKAQVDGSLGFARLAPHLHRYRAVMVFGTSGPAIAQELDACGVRCIQTTNLAAAVAAARGLAQSGDTILLSPACASFDEFRNFEHRGQCFAQLLQQWQDAAQ